MLLGRVAVSELTYQEVGVMDIRVFPQQRHGHASAFKLQRSESLLS